MDKINFTRQELYDLVWSLPILTLSKKYNISDVGLRKICIKMNIPLPKAGHWQKLKFGKKVVKISLPNNYQGDKEIILSIRNDNEHKEVPYHSEISSLQKEIEENLGSKLSVSERLVNPDKLIIAIKNSLLNREADRYLYIGTVKSWRNELDIRVSRANVGRTLRFLDTLIKALRLREHDVQIKNGEAYAIVEEEDFKIFVREKMKKVLIKDGTRDSTVYHPTGVLSFQSNHKEWKDGKLPLEQQLSKIIAHLEIAGKEWKKRRLQWKREQDERKEKERLQHEFLLLQEKDLAEIKETLSKASRWHKAVIDELLNVSQVEEIIFIPTHRDDFIGHADGIIRFIDDDNVIFNDLKNENEDFKIDFISALKNSKLDYSEIPFNISNAKTDCDARGIYIN